MNEKDQTPHCMHKIIAARMIKHYYQKMSRNYMNMKWIRYVIGCKSRSLSVNALPNKLPTHSQQFDD